MLDHVVRPFAVGQAAGEAVDGPGAGPHQVGARFVVIRMGEGDRRVLDDGLHHAFLEAVEHIHAALFIDEVVFHNMGENVGAAAGGLVLADGIGQRRVQERNRRAEVRVGDDELLLGFRVGDHADGVHFGAGRSEGEDGHDREAFADGRFTDAEIPSVAVIEGGRRDTLRTVDDGAAADGEEDVNAFVFADLGAGVDGGHLRVRIHARKLEPGQARLFDGVDDLVIQTGALDGTAAIYNKHLLPKG